MGGTKNQLLEIAEAEQKKMAKTNAMLWEMIDTSAKEKRALEARNAFLQAEVERRASDSTNLRRVLQEHTTAIAALLQAAADADDHIHHKQQECQTLRETLARTLAISAGSIPPNAAAVHQGLARPERSDTTLEASPP